VSLQSPRYSLEKVLQYFQDGRKGKLPEPAKDNLHGAESTEEDLARDLLPAMVKIYGALTPSKSSGYDTHEYISKVIPHVWETLEETSYANLNGEWFVTAFKISKESTPIVYEILGDDIAAVWDALGQGVRDEIVFYYLMSKGIGYDPGYNESKKHESPSFYKYRINRSGTVEDEGIQRIRNKTQDLINKWFLDQDSSDLAMAEKINIYGNLEKEIEKVKGIVKGTKAAGGMGGGVMVSTVENVKGKKALGAAREAARKKHKERAGLKYKELIKEAGKDGKAEGFFKTLEQCFLLTAVPELAAIRSAERTENINARGIPYGGRVIPIDCDPVENFINFASTTSDLYVHTLSMNTPVLNSIKNKFIVSNVVQKTIGGELVQVEEPLLFGGQTNIISEGEEPKFKHAILYKKGANEKVDKTPRLVEIGIDPPDQSNVNKLIHYSDLTISFIGENQATAKTNVNVTLKLRMPNLTYLQTEFEGKTTYVGGDGKTKSHDYTYSPVDLISYLNRSNLEGKTIPILKHKGGAKLYNPKFYRSYNRLVMKIIPTIEKADDVVAGSTDDKILEGLKEYIKSTALILDLALIDHTISRIDKTEGEIGDEITIEYKGFIRSRLQEPIFDCLRNTHQMNTLKELEKKLIKSLSLKDPSKPEIKKKIFEEIQNTNDKINNNSKTHKTDFKKNIFTRLRGNNRIYRMKYNPVSLLNLNVSKEFKIIGAVKLSEAVKASIPKIVRVADDPVDIVSVTKDNTTNQELNNDFLYFGDLVDVLMNNLYQGDPRPANATTFDQMDDDFKKFPLKVILPSFYPITLVKTTDGGSVFKTSEKKINLADFPISTSWLDQWIDKNIVEPDVAFYSLGPLMNSIIGDLINGMLVEDCYMNGSAEFLQFAVKSEFGLFGGKTDRESNTAYKNDNKTWMNLLVGSDLRPGFVADGLTIYPVAQLGKAHAPFFLKDPRLPMSEHCNFLVIYQQISVFANYKNLSIEAGSMADNGIPYFNVNGRNQYGHPNPLTSGMTFSKATANYQRESRFQMESLFSLSQLASVYNVSIDTNLMLLDLYPGMLIYADAGLYQDSSIRGSIAHTLGMGGFHLTEKITHTAKIVGNVLNTDKTKIEANWIHSGAGSKFATDAPPSKDPPPPPAEKKK